MKDCPYEDDTLIEQSLAPGLLLAMPQLDDPNFARAVVLMVEHNERGSFGLVLNQPTQLETASLLEAISVSWSGDSGALVGVGGPVMPASGWLLHEPTGVAEELSDSLEQGGTIRVVEGIDLSTSLPRLKAIAEEPPKRTRLLLGYSGWGPGQLAEEMARGSWLCADVSSEMVFDVPEAEMWETAIRSLGLRPESIVPSSGIH